MTCPTLCQEPAFPPLHQTALRDFCESNTSCAGGRFLRSHDWIQFDHIATCKFELYWEKSQEPAVIFFFFCVRVCVLELCHKIQQWWWWGNQVAACLQNRSETSIIETFTTQACRETVDSVCLCAHVSERQAQMFLCTPFASTHTGGARCLITEICPVEKHIHDAPKSSITHADSWTRIVASYVKTWN